MDSKEQQSLMKKYWQDNTTNLQRAMWIEASVSSKCTMERFLEGGRNWYNKCFLSIEKELPNMKNSLEIGCGMGRLVFPVCSRFETSYGIDISENMIKYANDIKASNPKYTSANFMVVKGLGEIPLLNDSISYIYSFICFQHIPFREVQLKYISEIDRILIPKGVARLLIQHSPLEGKDIGFGKGLTREHISSTLAKTNTSILRTEDHDSRNYWVILKKRGINGSAGR